MKINIRAASLAAIVSILTACASLRPAPPTSTATAPTTAPQPTTSAVDMVVHGMDHGSMRVYWPFDTVFIVYMISHHEGSIGMASQALTEAQRPEIKKLAEDIIRAQAAEIKQMREWRNAWYPDLKDTGEADVPVTPGDAPFDIRFIDAMIPHYEGAIMMAKEAQQKAQHAEIKQLADAIIKAQTAEIERMKQWRTEWTK